MTMFQPDFPILDSPITVIQTQSALPERLDLGSPQNDSGFISLMQFVIPPGFPILGYQES